MSFPALQLTIAGKELINKALTGEQLKFTKLAVGSGDKPENIDDITDLVKTIMVIDINTISSHSGYVTLTGVMENSKNTTEWWWKEIGVYAEDPEKGEVLYAYSNANEYAEHIPAYTSASFVQTTINVSVIVGQAQNISASLGGFAGYITATQFQKHTEWLEKHDKQIKEHASALITTPNGVNGLRVTDIGILQYWTGKEWVSVLQSPVIEFRCDESIKYATVDLYKCGSDETMDDSTFIATKTSANVTPIKFTVSEYGIYRVDINLTYQSGDINNYRQNIEINDCSVYQIELN